MSFLDAAFLWGLGAIAIPLAIHMLHSRKRRRVPFPTLRFLREVEARTASRRRIIEWILLLLRVGALAALALAMSGPYLRSVGTGRASSRVILLDDSLSMQSRLEDGTRFERAQRIARELVEGMEEGDRASILRTSDDDGARGVFTEDRRDLLDAIDRAPCGVLACRLQPAVRRALKTLDEDPAPARELIVLSDLQASGFREGEAPLAEEEGVSIFLVAIGAEEVPNAAVGAIDLLPSPRAKTQVRIGLVSHGAEESVQRTRLALDGRPVDERAVRVPARGEASTSLAMPPLAPGSHVVQASIDEDALAPDNILETAIRIPASVEVLIAREARAASGSLDPAFYLARALASAAGGGERLHVRSIAVDQVDEATLATASVLFLLEPSTLDEARLDLIEGFVRAGGGLFLSSGPWEAPEESQALLARISRPAQVTLGRVLPFEAHPYRLAVTDGRHPLWRALTEVDPPLRVETAAFTSVRELAVSDETLVLARFSGASPAMLEFRAGRGRVVYFASSLSTAWGNFPLRYAYAPFVHGAVSMLLANGEEPESVVVDTKLVLRHGKDEGFSEATLEAPGLSARKIVPRETGEVLEADFGPLARAGVYWITERVGRETRRWARIVRLPPEESRLERIAMGPLEAAFPGAHVIATQEAEAIAHELRSATGGMLLRGACLAFLLAFLLVEPWVARGVAWRRGQAGPLDGRDRARDTRGRKEAPR